MDGIFIPKSSVYCVSIPSLSYSLSSCQGSKFRIKSIFSVSFTAPIPNIFCTSTIPIPRISTKCFITAGDEPTSVIDETRRISTASSATSLCPRFKSSIAVSLFPTPLSPKSKIPSPYTSTKTPWREIRGAKWTLSAPISAAINGDVLTFVLYTGIAHSCAALTISGYTSSPRATISAGE